MIKILRDFKGLNRFQSQYLYLSIVSEDSTVLFVKFEFGEKKLDKSEYYIET